MLAALMSSISVLPQKSHKLTVLHGVRVAVAEKLVSDIENSTDEITTFLAIEAEI